MENQIFDLGKIKEITKPIEDLEGKISEVEEVKKTLENQLTDLKEIVSEKEIIKKVENAIERLESIQNSVFKLSKTNLNKFLNFQDLLIKKYKDKIGEDLKKFHLDLDKTKKLGLYLIENRKISTIISDSSWIPSISVNQWIKLVDSLQENTIFQNVIKEINEFYNNLVLERLNTELENIPNDTDENLIQDYKQKYVKTPLSFREYLLDIEKQLSREELKTKEEVIKQNKEKEKIERLKQKQEEQRDSFQDYFKYSEKEFQRRIRKKKRQSLSDISEKPKLKTELSEEVSEKIEKFKSKFDHKFQNELLIKRENNLDPLDLIRERKERKKKEYKQFIKRLEDNE